MITMNVQYLMFQRNIHNKSIRELSDEIEIPRQALTSYMNNTFKMINREHLDKLVDYFECSMDELITFSKQLNMDLDNTPTIETSECKSKQCTIDELPDYNSTMTIIKHIQKKKKLEREKKLVKELFAELEEQDPYEEEICGLFGGSGKTKSTQSLIQSYLDSVIEKKIKDELDELVSKLGFESLD